MHDLVICGGGISGLALAHFARREGLEDVVVLEAEPRPGGKVQTDWVDGWCCEWGPQGFLDNVPDTLELVEQAGLSGELVRAGDAAGDRFIMRRGRLRRVPLTPPSFLASDVLPLSGKLRLLLEPFMGKGAEEESVLDFASRRIGRQAATVLVDAMVTGVYAGDPARLSLPATFPKMRAMESAHGSLTRAMIARRRSGGGGGPAGPGGTLTTFRRGMQELTDTLASELGPRLRLASPVQEVRERPGGGFTLTVSGEKAVEARRVAVAVLPGAAARILSGLLSPEALQALRDIPTVRVAVVMTGYASADPFHHPTKGFGFLVPGREKRDILGTIFCDSTFPGQAPAGSTLLRTLVGGARNGHLVDLADAELLPLVRRELAAALGGDPQPNFVRIMRHDVAIPQYTLGHLDRLAAIRTSAARLEGLALAGNGYRGIALNACVTEARSAAAALAAVR